MDIKKEYSIDEVVYDEFYKVKLGIFYFFATFDAILIVLFTYYITDSLETFLIFAPILLMFGYKMKFNKFMGEQYSIFLIEKFATLITQIKDRR